VAVGVGLGVGDAVGFGVAVGVALGVAVGVGAGVAVADAVGVGAVVGLGVGLGVAFGLGVTPQVEDVDVLRAAPPPLAGMVGKPWGCTPLGVKRRAAIRRMARTLGSWIDPRAS